jgi:hypothetical protein
MDFCHHFILMLSMRIDFRNLVSISSFVKTIKSEKFRIEKISGSNSERFG